MHTIYLVAIVFETYQFTWHEAQIAIMGRERYSGHLHPECEAALIHPKTQEWIRESGYTPGDQGRGRIDDLRKAPPQFRPDGSRNSARTGRAHRNPYNSIQKL